MLQWMNILNGSKKSISLVACEKNRFLLFSDSLVEVEQALHVDQYQPDLPLCWYDGLILNV